MRVQSIVLLCLGLLTVAAATSAARDGNADLKKQVAATERAFAATMQARDFAGFNSFVADEAVFFSGPTPLRGKTAIGQAWRKFYDKPQAPFSWEPEEVEVVDSGTLAMTSGPVKDPSGKLVGRFNSVWRLEAPGVWKVVFDRGSDVCDCKK